MRILIGNWLVKNIGEISKHELDRQSAQNPDTTVIELENETHWNEIFFWSVTSEGHMFWIVIYSGDSYFPPTIVSHDDDNLLLLYYGNCLAGIDLCEEKVRFDYRTDSTVFTVKIFKNTFVVVSEIDIVQLQKNGDVLVRYALDDILEAFEFKEESIVCKTMNSCTEYLLLPAQYAE